LEKLAEQFLGRLPELEGIHLDRGQKFTLLFRKVGVFVEKVRSAAVNALAEAIDLATHEAQ